MSAPVISAEKALELNRSAQKINPILFWTCNYEPTPCYALSEDARFLIGIQDLYKFAIDTNCILKKIANDNGIWKNILSEDKRKALCGGIETIQSLRAVMDHNHSDLNGSLSQKDTQSVKIWIQKWIHKEHPISQEDYAELNSQLRSLGELLEMSSKVIITNIQQSPNSKQLSEKWINEIVEWYCAFTRQNYYKGQLSNYYIAKLGEQRKDLSSVEDYKDFALKIRKWVQLQVLNQFDAPIRECMRTIEELEKAKKAPSSIDRKVEQSNPEVYEKVLRIRAEELLSNKQKLSELEQDKKEFKKRCNNNLVGYFYKKERMKQQLLSTLEVLQNGNCGLTLLPQDFLFLDIERNFSGVRAPDGDFK